MLKFIKRHPILFVLFLLIVGAVTLGVIQARKPKPTSVWLDAVAVTEELSSVINASGEIRAHEMVDIQTEVAGIITDLPVVEGQVVKEGQVILRVDPFQAEMDQASASAQEAARQADVKRMDVMVASANANVAKLNHELKVAEVELAETRITHKRAVSGWKRQSELRESRVVSQDQLEEYESQMDLAAKRIEAAESRIEQVKAQLETTKLTVEEQEALKMASEHNLKASEAALKRAEDNLKKTTIYSPLNGVIVRLNVEVGERAVPGIQSNPEATLMTIANLSVIEAEIEVDETDIASVKLGQAAKIEVDALEDVELSGRVTEIGKAPITSGSNSEGKDFKVVIAIDNPSLSLSVGMSCDVEITVETRKDILTAPIQSLVIQEVRVDDSGNYIAPPKPVEGEKKKEDKEENDDANEEEIEGVFVMDSDNLTRFKPVEVGILGETDAEIISGLEEGEKVITGPLKALRELKEWDLLKEDKRDD